MSTPKYISIREAAALVGLAPTQILRLIRAGALAAEIVAGRWLVRIEHVRHVVPQNSHRTAIVEGQND